ncbi:hypothetical protein F4678DRAFT_54402 [Xylaria arbuscula]|nr:hypothetical protein F4678DRAFT_54402 [Xylaria arbuscula]
MVAGKWRLKAILLPIIIDLVCGVRCLLSTDSQTTLRDLPVYYIASQGREKGSLSWLGGYCKIHYTKHGMIRYRRFYAVQVLQEESKRNCLSCHVMSCHVWSCCPPKKTRLASLARYFCHLIFRQGYIKGIADNIDKQNNET